MLDAASLKKNKKNRRKFLSQRKEIGMFKWKLRTSSLVSLKTKWNFLKIPRENDVLLQGELCVVPRPLAAAKEEQVLRGELEHGRPGRKRKPKFIFKNHQKNRKITKHGKIVLDFLFLQKCLLLQRAPNLRNSLGPTTWFHKDFWGKFLLATPRVKAIRNYSGKPHACPHLSVLSPTPGTSLLMSSRNCPRRSRRAFSFS